MRSSSAARTSPVDARRARRGFTLLETLAAVAMMLTFYGILSAQGLLGFDLEGDAERRLTASLLADRTLADLEAAAAAGVPPVLGTSDAQEDGYDVRVEVTPWVPPWAASDDEPPPRGAPPSLIGAPDARAPAPILQVRVVVAWDDGRPRFVERTTFALDAGAVAAVLEAAGVLGATDAQGNPIFGTGSGNDSGTRLGEDQPR